MEIYNIINLKMDCGDKSTLKSNLDSCGSEVTGLASSWKGASYDNLSSKVDSFSLSISKTPITVSPANNGTTISLFDADEHAI